MEEKEFLALVDRRQKIIHKICRVYRDTKEDREDLFQEIVFELWKSAKSFRGEADFGSWMYKIALNTAISSFRKKKPHIHYAEVLPDRADEERRPNDQQEKLLAVLKQLNDADKALITLYLEDISHREIAEITGISENNVAVKLSRIRTKIQQLLNTK